MCIACKSVSHNVKEPRSGIKKNRRGVVLEAVGNDAEKAVPVLLADE